MIRMINSLKMKLRNMIKIGEVTRSGNDNGTYSIVQVSYMGQVNEAENITPYGYYSMPPVGSSALLFNKQANAAKLSVISQDIVNREKGMEPGTIILKNTQSEVKIKLLNDGTVEIEAQTIKLVAPSIEITGDNVTISGNVSLGGAGGEGVARFGDSVQIGTSIGKITSASSTVTAS